MNKKLIGTVVTFKIKGRKDHITGVVLNYNDEWTHIRRCIDYSLDGHTIFRNNKVEYIIDDYEKRVKKILTLKKYDSKKERKIPLESLDKILSFIDKNHKLIQIDTSKGDAFDVVKYNGQKDLEYFFDELMPDGRWRYKLNFKESICKCISFDNDYLNSLSLITKFNEIK